MKLLMVLLMTVSTSAMSAGYKQFSKSFVIPTITNTGHVYYNCDSVETKAKKVLEKMGAENIRVRCSGGLATHRGGISTSAFVRASYKALSSEVNDTNISTAILSENINSRDNCHLINAIFLANHKNFEISKVDMNRCFRHNDRLEIDFDVLKEVK